MPVVVRADPNVGPGGWKRESPNAVERLGIGDAPALRVVIRESATRATPPNPPLLARTPAQPCHPLPVPQTDPPTTAAPERSRPITARLLGCSITSLFSPT